MNSLFRHIEFLLTRHDCVIVPGLGAFIVTTVPAVIDRVNRRVSPPSRSVMFNQAVTLDDGLLANSYARRLDLSFEEARQIVLKDVANLLDILHAELQYRAGNLGMFTLGDENQVVFQPHSSSSQIAERNGLYSFSLSEIPSQTPSSNKDPEDFTEQISTSEAEDISDDKTDHQYFQFRINRSLIKFTAAFAVFAAIALAVLLYPIPHDLREHRASVVPVEALIPTQTQKKQTPPVVNDTLYKVEKALQHPGVIPETKPKTAEYFLIVATFHSKKEAERYVSLHSSDEFKLETVSSRKVTRVYVASSSDKKELLTELNSSRISDTFPNAWIWASND